MNEWLTQDIFGSLLDESASLNESFKDKDKIRFKDKYILTVLFRHLLV